MIFTAVIDILKLELFKIILSVSKVKVNWFEYLLNSVDWVSIEFSSVEIGSVVTGAFLIVLLFVIVLKKSKC